MTSQPPERDEWIDSTDDLDDEVDLEERQLNLVAFLMKSQRPVRRDQIIEEVDGYRDLGETEAAALQRLTRDRRRLASLGIVIRHVSDAWGDGWVIDKSATLLPPISLTGEERLLLETVARAYEGDTGTGRSEFATILSSALFKLRFDNADERPRASRDGDRETADDAGGAVVVGSSSTLRDNERRNLDLLLEASLARKQVKFRYRRPAGDTETRTIDPHGMAFVRGAWYLAGYSHERDSDRIFRLSRIEGDAFLLNEGGKADFDPPADYRVQDTVARLMNPRDDNEHERRFEEVRLRILPDAAFMVAEWASADEALAARFTRADDGSGILTLHQPLERSVWRLLAEYAPVAAVEYPAELRDSVRERLLRMRAMYDTDPATDE